MVLSRSPPGNEERRVAGQQGFLEGVFVLSPTGEGGDSLVRRMGEDHSSSGSCLHPAARTTTAPGG